MGETLKFVHGCFFFFNWWIHENDPHELMEFSSLTQFLVYNGWANLFIMTIHMKRSVSSTTHTEWGYQMTKTACQSNAGFRRHKLLKSVVVGPGRAGSVGRLCVEKSPYPVRTRECFALARNKACSSVLNKTNN